MTEILKSSVCCHDGVGLVVECCGEIDCVEDVMVKLAGQVEGVMDDSLFNGNIFDGVVGIEKMPYRLLALVLVAAPFPGHDPVGPYRKDV